MQALAPSFTSVAPKTRVFSRHVSSLTISRPMSRLRPFVVRAEKETSTIQETLEDVAQKVEDKAQELVDKTKENSGLNNQILGKQPGGTGSKLDNARQEAFSFSGLLPEIINGRAAMVGMLAAFFAELRTHEPVFLQIQKDPSLIIGAFLLIFIGSVAPVVRQADLNKQGAGPFTSRAEVWNGRLAMVAFAALIAVETWKAGPGLPPY